MKVTYVKLPIKCNYVWRYVVCHISHCQDHVHVCTAMAAQSNVINTDNVIATDDVI